MVDTITPLKSEYAKAFNLGVDARLKGEGLELNPYVTAHVHEWRYWQAGWRHADHYWGVGVKGRWKFLRLKEVQECH